jgi:regulator of protease activity HflC (stomatin/prohibitin superfamily)
LGILDDKLRFFTPEGELVLTPEEEADAQRDRANSAIAQVEAQRDRANSAIAEAEAERQRSALLRQKLQELGINPDEL